jgi:hypothetical protein
MKLLEKIILMLIFLMFIPFTYAQSCHDPDGLDYSQKNCVTFNGVTDKYCDSCISSKLLIEWYCTGNKLNLTTYYCPGSCSEGKCVSSVTTTTTIQGTTTSTLHETTTPTTTPTTSTTIPSVTTTTIPTIPGFSRKTIEKPEHYESCSGGYNIECNQIVRRDIYPVDGYDLRDYFKFTLDRTTKVRIRLNSTIIPVNQDINMSGDYDLYVKWDGSCPVATGPYHYDTSYRCYSHCECNDQMCIYCIKEDCCDLRTEKYFDCGSCSNEVDEYENMNEFCPEEGERTLEPGTYYFFVYDFLGDAPYEVTLSCSDVTPIATTTVPTTTSTTLPSCPYSCQCRCYYRIGIPSCICSQSYEDVYEKVNGYSCPYDYTCNANQVCCKKVNPDISVQLDSTTKNQGDVLKINITGTDDKGISQIELEVFKPSYELINYSYDCAGKTPCTYNWSIVLDQVGFWEFEARLNDTDNKWGFAKFPPNNFLFLDVNVLPAGVTITTTTTTSTMKSSTTTTTTTLSGMTTTIQTTTTLPESEEGCPVLKVWNGNEYKDVVKLNIHSEKGKDTTTSISFSMEPKDGKYYVKLSEIWYALLEGSHIDSVKLVDESGKECKLVSAVHDKKGDVLTAIAKSDDVRIETKPGEEINLVFEGCEGEEFVFSIEGYNQLPEFIKMGLNSIINFFRNIFGWIKFSKA